MAFSENNHKSKIRINLRMPNLKHVGISLLWHTFYSIFPQICLFIGDGLIHLKQSPNYRVHTINSFFFFIIGLLKHIEMYAYAQQLYCKLHFHHCLNIFEQAILTKSRLLVSRTTCASGRVCPTQNVAGKMEP